MTQLLLPAPSERNLPKKSNYLKNLIGRFATSIKSSSSHLRNKRIKYSFAAVIDFVLIVVILLNSMGPAQNLISPLIGGNLKPLTESKSTKEVFGFAPYWTFHNLDNVDFDVLTTFAYFGVDIDGEGNLDRESKGYQTFKSDKATEIFKKAHAHNTRVVLTFTQMDNGEIKALMDSPENQEKAITSMIKEVKDRGIDGINVDFEYTGNPGQDYRDKFSKFVSNLTTRIHAEIPSSKVTVSVYASAVKEPKIYDIAAIGQSADGIFMMAYDFAVAKSDNAIPTAPLYGHKEGKYWYDVSTAVADFLKQMPAEKLILGVPYYGYNYLVYEPEVKAETRPYGSWRGTPRAQTYTIALENITPDMEGVDEYKTGWDDYGKVNYIAYHLSETDTWRMIFLDDHKSLGIKYDFAKEQNLAGVGMWALGFDNGKQELWGLLAEKFGTKSYADNKMTLNEIR